MKTFLIAFALALASSAWSPPADAASPELAVELHADQVPDVADPGAFDLLELLGLVQAAEPAPHARRTTEATEVRDVPTELALLHRRHPMERRDDDPIHHLLEIVTDVEYLAALDRHWRPATNVDDRPRSQAPRRRLE